MAKRFELLVFDWDGTLMDSAATIVSCMRAAAMDLGLAPPPPERARRVIGLGLHQALTQAIPELAIGRHEELADRYRHHYLSQDQELALFAGAGELLREMAAAGYLLAVATGKSRKGLDRAMAVAGLDEVFHATRCADECHSKPHPQMLDELMAEFGLAPDVTLMVGDTTHDLEMARNASVAALAVSYGAHPREALQSCSPLYCADSVADMAAWLRANA